MNVKKEHRRKGVKEHTEQVQLFQWAAMQTGKYPELDMLFAIPNGTRTYYGAAVKAKREGVKAGVPDMLLPVPRGTFHGLWIEMKAGYNKPKDNQVEWINKLKEHGYCVWVCYSAQDAQDVIMAYLKDNILELAE